MFGKKASSPQRKAGRALPPGKFRMGGEHFKDDEAFIKTAVKDVKRLEKYCDLSKDSRLLDWGCGAGRLAVGVREWFEGGRIADYHGVDIQPELIEWAETNLAGPGYRFTLLDVSNERYNPDGTPERTLGAEPGTVDVFYAYSVFSHMNDEDTPAYLRLIAEALAPGGKAFVTCFVEEDVEGWEENPEGYGPLEWKGRLHCTRFARWHFEDHVNAARLAVDRFEYGRETDGQSLYVLRKR
ncbi:MAG: class I SAM-dependent methyltransferase [Candidatus Nanopelagicales bacterium]|nr:class I SAM-dependent methyltransferase [Candidatus Nanopelagicales bacterium]MCF8556212.1 class I SAM-dependent methyltransferase [Candidatus Nanopelagicales bacterium]